MLGETYTLNDELGSHTIALSRGSELMNRALCEGLNDAVHNDRDPHLCVSLRQMIRYVHGITDRVPSMDVWRTLIESNDEMAFAYSHEKRLTVVKPNGSFDSDVQSALQFAHEPHPVHVDDLPDVPVVSING